MYSHLIYHEFVVISAKLDFDIDFFHWGLGFHDLSGILDNFFNFMFLQLRLENFLVEQVLVKQELNLRHDHVRSGDY